MREHKDPELRSHHPETCDPIITSSTITDFIITDFTITDFTVIGSGTLLNLLNNVNAVGRAESGRSCFQQIEGLLNSSDPT